MNAIPTLRLDAGHNCNWENDAGPVAILNDASTLHERVAFCWAMASDIQEMAELFSTRSENTDITRVCALFMNQIRPLVAMLEHIGSSTCHSESQTGGEA